MKITVVGLDIAKQVFHVLGFNQANRAVLKKVLKRPEVLEYFAQMGVCTIAIEACAGSNYWGRELEKLGHQVRLIPAQHVKPLRRGQKNDFNDALAIAEALGRPEMRFVSIKSTYERCTGFASGAGRADQCPHGPGESNTRAVGRVWDSATQGYRQLQAAIAGVVGIGRQ